MSEFKFLIPKRKIKKVFIHCSASDRPEDDNIQTIEKWHKARGWSGIGYHYYIDKSGNIWNCRNIEVIPAAQYGYNSGSIAICCGGNNSFTVAQFYKLKEICYAIASSYSRKGISLSFHGHCEVSAKTCPNFDYRSVLKLDESGFMISYGNQH